MLLPDIYRKRLPNDHFAYAAKLFRDAVALRPLYGGAG